MENRPLENKPSEKLILDETNNQKLYNVEGIENFWKKHVMKFTKEHTV